MIGLIASFFGGLTVASLWPWIRGALRSWTIRVNAAIGAIALAVPVIHDNVDVIQETLPQLQPYLSDSWYKHVSLVLILANMVLRFRTSTHITER